MANLAKKAVSASHAAKKHFGAKFVSLEGGFAKKMIVSTGKVLNRHFKMRGLIGFKRSIIRFLCDTGKIMF